MSLNPIGVLRGGSQMTDGVDDALVVFDANVLAMSNSRVVTATDSRNVTYLFARDVQAMTFSTE